MINTTLKLDAFALWSGSLFQTSIALYVKEYLPKLFFIGGFLKERACPLVG